MRKLRAIWRAQEGPQEELIMCPADIILIGGARGGGKTVGALVGDWFMHMQALGADANGLVVRRHATHGANTQEEMRQTYERFGSRGGKPPHSTFQFPSGARLKFSFLANDQDAAQFSGHNYTWILIEEANQIADWTAVFKLLAALRSSKQVPERRFIMTCNPEGPGLGWLRDRFITPAPEGRTIFTEKFGVSVLPDDHEMVEQPLRYCFIPSLVQHNKQLLTSDPQYLARLAASAGGEGTALFKAWVQGDWDAMSGQFFSEYGDWRERGGVVHRFRVPDHWPRFVSGDWGAAKPFCFHWWAIVPETARTHRGTLLPKGALVLYREWYGIATDGQGRPMPDQGVKMDSATAGRELARRGRFDPPRKYAVLDPACFHFESGPTIAEQLEVAEAAERATFGAVKLPGFERADNKRTPGSGAAGGWNECRLRMHGLELEGVRRPMVYVFDTCHHLLRTMVAMVHDPNNPEDLLKKGMEDHAVDSFRYGIMSRPTLHEAAVASLKREKFTYESVLADAGQPTRFAPERGAGAAAL